MREPYLGAAVGKKNSGKTFITERMIRDYVRGHPERGVPARRVLIMDVNDEYENVRAIALEHIVRFSVHTKIEARRIRPFQSDGTRMTLDEVSDTLHQILFYFRGGLLLIEDPNKYISDNLPQDVIGAICTNRHVDLDIIMHFQGIGRITPKIWQNLNWLRFHKNTQSVDQHRDKFEDKYELLKVVELMVNHQYYDLRNKYYYAYVDIENEKLVGNYGKDNLEWALDKYISTSFNKVVKPLMNEQTPSGQKKFNAEEAAKEVKRRFYTNYIS